MSRLKKKEIQEMKIPTAEAPFLKALRLKYPAQDYVILSQVPIHFETQYRVADALVVGQWASRDPVLHGFEIKSSRQNWLTELAQPGKADLSSIFCDTWSLFAYPGVADKHEIPVVWGHYELDQDIKLLKEPQRLQPKPITREFLYKLLKKLNEQAFLNVETISIEHEYKRGYLDGKDAGAREADQASDYLEARLLQHTRTITALTAKLRELGVGAETEVDLEKLKFVTGLVSKWRYRIPELEKLINLLSSGSIQDTINKMNMLLTRTKEIETFLLPKIQGLQEFVGTKEVLKTDPQNPVDSLKERLTIAKAKLLATFYEFSAKRGTKDEENAFQALLVLVEELRPPGSMS